MNLLKRNYFGPNIEKSKKLLILKIKLKSTLWKKAELLDRKKKSIFDIVSEKHLYQIKVYNIFPTKQK